MNHKNSYKIPKNFLGTKPYVYFLRHKPTGIWYIGSKYSANAHPDYFFVNYFTSSEFIHELMEDSSPEDFEYRILKTFSESHMAAQYERRLLTKTKAVSNEKCANLSSGIQGENAIHIKNSTRMITNIKTGKCIRVKKDSITPVGFVNGNKNAKGQTKKRVWYHDPVTMEMFHVFAGDTPKSEWLRGRGNSLIGKRPKQKGLKRVVNDGTKNVFININDPLPNGFTEGSKSFKRETNSGRIVYTNGVENIYIRTGEEIPEGFYIGGKKLSPAANKGKIAINNGIENRYIDWNAEIPDGFVIGGRKIK
jgi:hypothetical protein